MPMRRVTLAAVVIAAAAMPAAVGARLMSGGASSAPSGGPIQIGPTGQAAVVLPNRAGAKRVQLTLKLRRELECGHLRGSSVLVDFPAAFSLPRQIPGSAVRVGGGAVRGVSVSQGTHAVRITLQPLHGVMCYAITTGSITVAIDRAAGIANPARRGQYRVTVMASNETSAASIKIR